MSFLEEAVTDHVEILQWISKQQGHIPVADMEFMMGLPPCDHSDDDHSYNWE